MGRLTGERRAVAAALLAFYGVLFAVAALQPMPGWGPAFAALGVVYGLGFFALVAGYFWARWYAIGIGISGAISAGVSMWKLGLEPVLLFYGGTHAAVSLILWGRHMASLFDGRPEWRERFHMDDDATGRLGKAVIRASVSLPYIVLYALAPRDDSGMDLALVGAALLAGAGIWALVRLRTWGVVAMAAAGVALMGTLATSASQSARFALAFDQGAYVIDLLVVGVLAGALLLAAASPFAGPLGRYLAGHRAG